MHEQITLRPICDSDQAFLYRLFCSTRAQSLETSRVPAAQAQLLLRTQFAGQLKQYREHYPAADFDIVLNEGATVGSLYALRGPDTFVLIDIALLPEYRGSGIGTHLVKALIAEAGALKKPLHAHVLKTNRAWRLWERLGFEVINDDGVHFQIRVPVDFT
jgi:ribosomal protein S18 acetylase RimI-like enzyme